MSHRKKSHTALDLPQDLLYEENSIDQHAICRALDLEVAEEGVGAEEQEDFV
jgi:hypothetical protein